uniref:helix-turn-helix domain-containing protein n=1 Tax=Citrobacter freundii TaxID=546 RepID=UPI0035CAC031
VFRCSAGTFFLYFVDQASSRGFNAFLFSKFLAVNFTFIPPETPEVGSAVNFASSVEDLVTQTLEFTIEEVNADRNVSNNAKNRQIVLNLYEKGIFDIKDAINQVADRLNISKHTVYLYIRQFKSGDFQGQDK